MPEEGQDPRATAGGAQRTAPTDENEKKADNSPAKWKWLYSSNLVQYRYQASNETLAIRFHGNRAYTFRGVDKDTADGLGTAASAGHYFHTKIKGKFPFSRGVNDGGESKKDRFGGSGATGSWDEGEGGGSGGSGGSGATGSW